MNDLEDTDPGHPIAMIAIIREFRADLSATRRELAEACDLARQAAQAAQRAADAAMSAVADVGSIKRRLARLEAAAE